MKKKKRTGRSKNPGDWSLEFGAYTGRSFDISNWDNPQKHFQEIKIFFIEKKKQNIILTENYFKYALNITSAKTLL
jgi:hypothetical protein